MRLILSMLAGAAFLAACAYNNDLPPTPPPAPSPQIVASPFDDLIRAEEMTLVQFPSSTYQPGAILRGPTTVGQPGHWKWEGDVSDCGATPDEARINEAIHPGFSTSQEFDVTASASLGLLRQVLGGSFEHVRKVALRAQEGNVDSLSQFRLAAWRERIAASGVALPPLCRELASNTPQGLYIVDSAFGLRNGSYSLEVKSDASVTVPELLQSIVDAEAGFVSDDIASVSFSGKVYFAIGALRYAGGAPLHFSDRHRVSNPDEVIRGGYLAELLGQSVDLAPTAQQAQ
jgi:hypothetical protein